VIAYLLEVLGHENQINGAQKELSEDQHAGGQETGCSSKTMDPFGALLVGYSYGFRHGDLGNLPPPTALRHASDLLALEVIKSEIGNIEVATYRPASGWSTSGGSSVGWTSRHPPRIPSIGRPAASPGSPCQSRI